MENLTTKEVAEKLEINENTLRKWIKDFELEIKKDTSGYMAYTSKDIEFLETVKALRNDDNGINTVRKKLGGLYTSKNTPYTDKETLEYNNINTSENNDIYGIYTKLSKLENTLETKIDSLTDLSEKLSRASFEIGKLGAEKVALEDKLKLISDGSGKDVSNLNKEIERLKLDNEYQQKKHRMENEQLKTELDREKKKPWYKKIFSYGQ